MEFPEVPPPYSEGYLNNEIHAPDENSEGYLNSEIHAPDDIRPRRERSTAATLISMMFVIPYVGILIASMVALGFMAVTHNSVRNYDLYDGHCLLYATHDTVGDNDVFKLSKGPVCKFIIYGEAALGVLAVVLILLSVVKAIVGKWLSPVMVFDYYALILGVIFSMSVGITLSVGIRVTCDAYKDAIPHAKDFSCSKYLLLSNDWEDEVYFYKGLHKVEQVAWIVFGLYSLMLIVQCAMTCISFGVKYMHKKNTLIPYGKFEDAYPSVQRVYNT